MFFGNRLAKCVGFDFLITFGKASLADCNALFAGDLLLFPGIDCVAISLHLSNTL